MLVLSRCPGEWLDFVLPDGQTISVGVQRVAGRKVRLMAELPDEVKVLRRELSAEYAPTSEAA